MASAPRSSRSCAPLPGRGPAAGAGSAGGRAATARRLALERLLDEIERKVEDEVRDALQWAFMQPDPAPEDALGHVYKEL